METFSRNKSICSRILLWLIVFNFECIFKNSLIENNSTNYSFCILFESQNGPNTQMPISNDLNNTIFLSFRIKQENRIKFTNRSLNKKTIYQETKHEINNYTTRHDTVCKQHILKIRKMSKGSSLLKACCKIIISNRYRPVDSKFILVLILSLLMISDQRTKNYPRDTKKKTVKEKSYAFLFQKRCFPRVKVKVYHFSLKKYVNELERKNDEKRKHMVHEWARLESFQSFPTQCPVSALRLAQSGFYSTGKGVEAVCFSCGLKNEHWTDDEPVSDVHKRLFPRCKFINGETTENVPIHGFSEVIRENTGGACGGPNDDIGHQRSNEKEYKEQIRQQQKSENKKRVNGTGFSDANTLVPNKDNVSLENENVDRRSDNHLTEEIIYFPGILNERPKFPEYATRRERLLSYTSWSKSNVMKPEPLTEAAFFFTGIQDLVRCFFCGGGMKSWEYGDSPWIEHARWFPACAYLKLCKGEDFINLCQMSSMTSPTRDNFQFREIDSRQALIVEDQQITDLNSIAAKRVFDIGYNQPQIEEAISHVRQTIGQSEVIKTQELLEYLLDNCHLTSNNNIRSEERVEESSGETNTSRRTNEENVSGDLDNKEERQTLKEENRLLKEQIMCKICLDKDANTVFLPCGHLVACVECAHALRKCAVCRKIIQGTVRAYPA